VLSRKLRAPDNPELAIDAIGEDGKLFLHDWLQHELQVDNSYIQKEKQYQLSEIVNRDMRYRKILPRIVPEGRDVIVTDDGIATGATFQAALWSVRHEKPGQLIAALPVGPQNSIERMAQDSDELVCLMVPPYFAAVGQFYSDFSQVEDDEVMAILDWENHRRKLKDPGASGKDKLRVG
jgi:putative phosphoribosyl transferase